MYQNEEFSNSVPCILGRLIDFPMFSDIRGPVRCLNHQEDLIDHDSDTESEQKDADLATTTDVENIVIANSSSIVRIC